MLHTNRSGFTILEVLLSIALVATAMSIIARIHARVLTRLEQNNDDIAKTFLLKRELAAYTMKYPKAPKKLEHDYEDLNLKVITKRKELGKKSSLRDLAPRIEEVGNSVRWKRNGNDYLANLNLFMFKPVKEKEKQ
jgi:prepilin-type N-terminal cleavage/methylation domain-containing protein